MKLPDSNLELVPNKNPSCSFCDGLATQILRNPLKSGVFEVPICDTCPRIVIALLTAAIGKKQ